MKSINFISPVPPKKQRALLIWLYGSAITFFVMISAVMYTHLLKRETGHRMTTQLTELKTHTTHLQNLKEQNEVLMQEKKMLEERLRRIQKIRHKSNNAFHLVTSLSLLIPQQVCLAEISGVPGKAITLKGFAKTTKAATEFFNKLLVSCPFITDLKLSSIMPAHEQKSGPLFTFTFEGTWQKELALFQMEPLSGEPLTAEPLTAPLSAEARLSTFE